MISEAEVYKILVGLINSDPNIRVAVLNGSRANPNAPKDFLQDYDVRVYVENVDLASKRYRKELEWLIPFGELVVMQVNDFDNGAFIVMSQFNNSLRIDLSFQQINKLHIELKQDSLSKILIDKDKLVQNIPESNETSYFVSKPSNKEWDETLNNLWWLQPYIAKELWRDEIPLVKKLYDTILMSQLRKILEWQVGLEYDWKINVGHAGKWLKRFLPDGTYEEFINLYSSANPEEQWEKLLRIGSFIQKVSQPLAVDLGYDYPVKDDERVSRYIREIYKVPKGSDSFITN